MTLVQIYNRVVFNLFGNSAVPQGTAVVLRGVDTTDSNGLIQNAHQEMMKDYNYWFMRTQTSYASLIGDHALPSDYKNVIGVSTRDEQMREVSQPEPISPSDYMELKQNDINSENTTSVVHPDYFDINNNNLTLYIASQVDPELDWDNLSSSYGRLFENVSVTANGFLYLYENYPVDPIVGDEIGWYNGTTYETGVIISVTDFAGIGAIVVTDNSNFTWVLTSYQDIVIYDGTVDPDFVYLDYWQILERLINDADYDELTVNGAEAIIYKTCSEYSMLRGEHNDSMMYNARYLERVQMLKHLDSQRRQNYSTVRYSN